MIEVRSTVLVKMKYVRNETARLQVLRDEILPELGWQERIESMLHGHAQQSLFVRSSEWDSLADWEAAQARGAENQAYQDWLKEVVNVERTGHEREVFTILEPATPADRTPGKVEIRSAYTVPFHKLGQAHECWKRGQEAIWPLLNWSGQNQQMLFGKAFLSMFVWSSVWDSVGEYEQSLSGVGQVPEFAAWFGEWKEIADYGSTREIFKIL